MPITSDVHRRWAYWLPFATIASKRMGGARTMFNPSQTPIQRFRILHERAIAKLLRMGVSWPVILRHDLDDPRIGEGERDDLIYAAQKRSVNRRPLSKQAQVRARKLEIQKGEL